MFNIAERFMCIPVSLGLLHMTSHMDRPNSKIWIPDITGPPGVKTKLILDLGLVVSEAPWSTLGGGANKKFWFFGLEFYFFFLAWFSEDITPGGHTEACSSLRPK